MILDKSDHKADRGVSKTIATDVNFEMTKVVMSNQTSGRFGERFYDQRDQQSRLVRSEDRLESSHDTMQLPNKSGVYQAPNFVILILVRSADRV